jgi:hypothetical protein
MRVGERFVISGRHYGTSDSAVLDRLGDHRTFVAKKIGRASVVALQALTCLPPVGLQGHPGPSTASPTGGATPCNIVLIEVR